MEDEIRLRVEKAYSADVGRGIIRVDPTISLKLDLGPGDIVEIRGQKRTAAKVWKVDRQDWEKGLVRIDIFTQLNAGVSIGETVAIKKVEALAAKKIDLILPDNIARELPESQILQKVSELIKSIILKRPVAKGDVIPIINAVPQLTAESLITDQVFTLVVDETEPSANIVQVSEETIVSLLYGKRQLNYEINRKVNYSSSLWDQFLESVFKGSKNDNEPGLRMLSENIVKTKDHYEKISSNIKEYNAKYAVEDSIILTILDDIVNKSDKVVYEYIYNLKLQDAFNYISELDLKLETYHKAALSETAHRKIKEIEFQISSPFFASKLRKNYKKLVSEFDKLDTAGIQGTKSTKEFMEMSERLMEKLQETEDDVEEEQKTGIRSTLKNIFLWGIPVLFSFYSLVADDYFTVNFYTPILFYILLSVVIYLLLKSGVNFKIIYLAYKTRIYKSKKYEFIILVIPLLVTPMVILASFKDFTTHSNLSFYFPGILILSFISMMIGTLLTLKDSVKEAKSKLIEKEINSLIKRYELDTLIQP